MGQTKVCLCEPFILPGILPTTGMPTIKAQLAGQSVSCRILYPSIRFFVEQGLYRDPGLLSLIDDTPLQFTEFLFVSEEREEEALTYVLNNAEGFPGGREQLRSVLLRLRDAAREVLEDTVRQIRALDPAVFCFSTTFGDLNFDIALVRRLRQQAPGIRILCGGSNCSPEYTQRLLAMIPGLDAAVCDEEGSVTTEYIRALLKGERIPPEIQPCLAFRGQPARKVRKVSDLNVLPCPDFDDFMEAAGALGLKREMLTLPYEYSRGCWWGEKSPCRMCGFFGTQKQYLYKEAEKVLREIGALKERYKIDRIRFTDLVHPRPDLIPQLLPLAELDLKYFWELRPDLTEEQTAMLRRIGLTTGQIGLESFSTGELCHMNKGPEGIACIHALRMLSDYKIEAPWNYLYGFEEDRAEWYEEVLPVIGQLYHLQPPSARKIWINLYSDLYNASDPERLTPVGEDAFHDERNRGYNYYYKVQEQEDLRPVHEKLCREIGRWREAFAAGYSLLVLPERGGGLTVRKEYGPEVRDIEYPGDAARLYRQLREPCSPDELRRHFPEDFLTETLGRMRQDGTVVFLDGQYLAVAVFPTPYRWTRFYDQPSYNGSRLIEGEAFPGTEKGGK